MNSSMGQVQELTNFYAAIIDDPIIGATHISLYMALFQFYNLNRFQNPVEITRAAVMRVAKINGIATFHKCIKDLNDYGYIHYLPSCNPAINIRVLICNLREG